MVSNHMGTAWRHLMVLLVRWLDLNQRRGVMKAVEPGR